MNIIKEKSSWIQKKNWRWQQTISKKVNIGIKLFVAEVRACLGLLLGDLKVILKI